MPYLISKALRYDPCVTRGSQFYLPPAHEPYLASLLSRKTSPPFGRYQLILLGDRGTQVWEVAGVFTLRARPRLEPTTSWSQVRHSTDSATGHWSSSACCQWIRLHILWSTVKSLFPRHTRYNLRALHVREANHVQRLIERWEARLSQRK